MKVTPEMRSAIEASASEAGIDPSLALAIADRESSFNPRATSSSTIRGLYQMQGKHRANYGIGDSDDPAVQTKGWVPFFRQVQKEMAGKLGRDPTDAEGYLGHHFGGARAGRMLKMHPDTPVNTVFTPREMAENPHFGQAGTVGQLNSSILRDIERRQAKFGGAQDVGRNDTLDFSHLGEPTIGSANGLSAGEGAADYPAKTVSAAPDFSSTSEPVENLKPTSVSAASSAPDFSHLGVPV